MQSTTLFQAWSNWVAKVWASHLPSKTPRLLCLHFGTLKELLPSGSATWGVATLLRAPNWTKLCISLWNTCSSWSNTFFIQHSLYFFVTLWHSLPVSALLPQDSVLHRLFCLPLNWPVDIWPYCSCRDLLDITKPLSDLQNLWLFHWLLHIFLINNFFNRFFVQLLQL